MKRLALLSLLTSLNCYYCEPDGIQAYQEQDGVLSEQEKQDYNNFSGQVKEFAGFPQQFVNDLDELIARDFKNKGLSSHRFGTDLYIYLGSTEDISAIHDELSASEGEEIESIYADGEKQSGFYRPLNNTIYMSNEWYERQEFVSIFFHEEGHYLGEGMSEYPSMFNQAYTAFKAYCLDNEIGYEFVSDTMLGWYSTENIDNYLPNYDDRKYGFGYLSFLVECNKTNGDMELALYNLLHSSTSYLEQSIRNVAGEYDTICDMIYSEYDILLHQPIFIKDMIACSNNNFEEYRNKLANRSSFLYEWLCENKNKE